MKNSHLVITLIAVLLVDGWWTGVLRWIVVGTVSSKIIGAAFNTLIDICAYHPDIWESSVYLLSLPSSSELKLDCPPGKAQNACTLSHPQVICSMHKC